MSNWGTSRGHGRTDSAGHPEVVFGERVGVRTPRANGSDQGHRSGNSQDRGFRSIVRVIHSCTQGGFARLVSRLA